MRTTVAISDELLAGAKRRAAERGLTLGQLVEAALQHELADASARPAGPPVPIFAGGSGPRPGLDLRSNRALSEALDEGLTLSELR